MSPVPAISKSSHAPRLWLAAILSLVLLSATTPAHAIENGRPDGPRHRNVGLLGIDFDGPNGPLPAFAFCSGFVISDSAFATAAHCIDVFGPQAAWSVTLESGSPDDPVIEPGWFDFSLFNITDFPIHAEVTYADAVCMHPDYNGAVGFEHDLAVLSFDSGTFDVPPVKLPQPGWLDHLAAAGSLTNKPLQLVGYGTEGRQGGGPFFVPGYRKTALTGITGVDANWLYYQPTDAWTGDTGFADSGSPQVLTGRAVSLQTFPHGQAQRLDTDPEFNFLNGLLAGGDCPS
jgi:hypothetical protein